LKSFTTMKELVCVYRSCIPRWQLRGWYRDWASKWKSIIQRELIWGIYTSGHDHYTRHIVRTSCFTLANEVERR